MEQKHSVLGIVSFCLSLCAGLLLLATMVVAGILQHGHPPGQYPGKEIVGLSLIAGLMVEIAVAILAIISMFEKGKRKLFGALGITVSGIALVGTGAIVLVGIVITMMKH